jgi:serine/threonine protein kinase
VQVAWARYTAHDTRLDRSVAIKVLPDQLLNNADFKQLSEVEARAISSLNHPNISHPLTWACSSSHKWF